MRTMLAARYLGPGRIEAREVPLPSIEREEALIKVEACGFCGSDISIVAGLHPRARAPFTLGHEFSGRITEIQNTSKEFAVGDLVTSYPLISCGRCYVCRTGAPHVCRSLRLWGFDEDGGMAEFVKLPVSSLVKLPHDMASSIGALLEPLAVAVHGVSRAPLDEVNTAAVLGAGAIGLLTALVVRVHGIRDIIIADILPTRLELAAKLGLNSVAAGEALREVVELKTRGEGADIVYECAGAPSAAREMTRLVRSQGTIVNLGVFKKPTEVDMQAVNFKELSIVGSRVYARQDFTEAIRLAPSLPLEQIVTHYFPLTDVQQAFDYFQRGEGVCKVIIRPNGSVS